MPNNKTNEPRIAIITLFHKVRYQPFVHRDQLLPESIPWLIANHKLEKAQSVVRRVFKIVHVRLPAALSVRRQVSGRNLDDFSVQTYSPVATCCDCLKKISRVHLMFCLCFLYLRIRARDLPRGTNLKVHTSQAPEICCC